MSGQELLVEKLAPRAVLPTRAHEHDAGWDLTATWLKIDEDSDIITYGTDLAVAIPVGHVGLLCSRSSISRIGLILANGVGIIDAGYRGELLLKFRRANLTQTFYHVGDRVGQLVVVPLTTLTMREGMVSRDTARGDGGFGSTGRGS